MVLFTCLLFIDGLLYLNIAHKVKNLRHSILMTSLEKVKNWRSDRSDVICLIYGDSGNF